MRPKSLRDFVEQAPLPKVPQPNKNGPLRGRFDLAGGPGFEPGFTESESVVLPLNDPPFNLSIYDTQNLSGRQ